MRYDIEMAAIDVLLEPDDRGRINLSRLEGKRADRYLAHQQPDGSIVLRPAALLSERALEAYVQVRIAQASRDPDAPLHPLDEYLEKHGVRSPTPEEIAAVEARLALRKRSGRTLGDVVAEKAAVDCALSPAL
jgi:hypothetical protein